MKRRVNAVVSEMLTARTQIRAHMRVQAVGYAALGTADVGFFGI